MLKGLWPRPVSGGVRAGGGVRVGVCALACVATASTASGGVGRALSVEASNATESRALLDQYCVTCHSDRLKTAGLTLQGVDLEQVGGDAQVLEKVVRKLRTGAMPPAGRPRPDAPTAERLVATLEEQLDRAAAAHPEAGRPPGFHRLNRTEYQNAIRDVLGVDDLPKDIDISLLLPADDTNNGFDNMADTLFVPPALLERYMGAARKLSRLAVGDAEVPVVLDTYRMPDDRPQDGQVDELPVGTRGGLLIRRYFPMDAEYTLKVQLGNGRGGGNAYEPKRVEITIDGARAHLVEVSDPAADRWIDPRGAFDVRLPVKAGPHAIGVTFLARSGAFDDGAVKPFTRNGGFTGSIVSVTVGGPYNIAGPGETPSRRKIFTCRPLSAAEEDRCARQILGNLIRRAYRRTSTRVDVDTLWPFFDSGRKERGFDTGVERALERLLVSPQFLFRIEQDPAGIAPQTAYRLSGLEFASRLSFFLWSSIPDDELLSVAASGKLQTPAVLEQQLRRMLADERAGQFTKNFAGQWLNLRDFAKVKPDEIYFPDFDDRLQEDLRRETELFFASLVREDRSVLELLGADYTFVNERLARHYGMPDISGSHFRRVALSADSPRRGILGKGSLLTVTSYAGRTSPVLRGKWILENLLGTPPPPPPPDVPSLRDTDSSGRVLSMRERMAQHRANPVCSTCHALMDPLGLSMENFDAVGRWRTRGESNGPIDAAGALPGGMVTFQGVGGLRDSLLSRPDAFVTTVSEKLLAFALGRAPQFFDGPAVRGIVRTAARNDYRFSSVLMGIVTSAPFQMRQSAPRPAATAAAR